MQSSRKKKKDTNNGGGGKREGVRSAGDWKVDLVLGKKRFGNMYGRKKEWGVSVNAGPSKHQSFCGRRERGRCLVRENFNEKKIGNQARPDTKYRCWGTDRRSRAKKEKKSASGK